MKLKPVEDEEIDIDMSSMIDMVFLLLIFFIVASVVVDMDKPLVELASASAAKVSEDTTGRVQVSIDRTEQVYIGPKPVTLAELKTQITAELEEDPNIRIFFRADREVPYGVTQKLMRACASVGALDLIFATFEE
jgi:biopolymer transport protein ExbD